MFSLFKKNVFLKEQLHGLVDIHNHILPGIDDGAANVEESLALIDGFRELGIKEFIATPHIMNDYYPNTAETIMAALDVLQNALEEKEITDVKIKAAAEYMMDQPFLELLEEQQLLCLSKNYVLVEMSYFQAPINLNQILFKLQTQSYKPILAHPERYMFYHSKNLEKYSELKSRGCYFQLNLLSLTGHYGKNIQEIAFLLLDQGMYDFTGSDTHQMRHLDKLLVAKLPQKKMEQLIPVIQKTKETFRICSKNNL